MKPSILFFFPFLILSTSCSSQYGITKASAFVRVQVAGTIRVDDSGKPKSSGLYKMYLIYIETDSNQPFPEWREAWIEGKAYSVRPVQVKQDLHLGQTNEAKEIVLKVSPHKRLWQLVLVPVPSAIADATIVKAIRANPVVLTGEWANKPFHYVIKKLQLLESIVGQ